MFKDMKTNQHQKNHQPSERNSLGEGRDKEITEETESMDRDQRLKGPDRSPAKINLLFKK